MTIRSRILKSHWRPRESGGQHYNYSLDIGVAREVGGEVAAAATFRKKLEKKFQGQELIGLFIYNDFIFRQQSPSYIPINLG